MERSNFLYGIRIKLFRPNVSQDLLGCSKLQEPGSSLGLNDFLKKSVRSENTEIAFSIFYVELDQSDLLFGRNIHFRRKPSIASAGDN